MYVESGRVTGFYLSFSKKSGPKYDYFLSLLNRLVFDKKVPGAVRSFIRFFMHLF